MGWMARRNISTRVYIWRSARSQQPPSPLGNKDCQFDHDGIEPGGIRVVFFGQIVDSLWLKQEERRQIRVS